MSSNQQVNNEYKIVTPPSPPPFTPEWALFKFLNKWEPSDLEIAIRKNARVDFSGSMASVVDYAVEEILKKFETYRPDLHRVLASASGRAWLRNQITRALTPK